MYTKVSLLNKIKTDERRDWWHLGQYIWSDDLTNALEEAFQRWSSTVQRQWSTGYPTDKITSALVMRLKPEVAERMLVKHWAHLQYSSYFVQAALYVATPITNALAQEVLSQCPDAGEMLKHADQNFGIKVVGHPGVNRIEQVETLVPYLDHLSPLVIHKFWELCNERGWLDFRRTHLDQRLEGQWREMVNFDEAQFFTYFDTEVAKDRIDAVDIWFDRYMRQGGQMENILDCCVLPFPVSM